MNNFEKDKFKDYFQANILDGDDVYDCGGAMVRAEDVFEVMNEYHKEALQTQKKKIVEKIEEKIEGLKECIKLEKQISPGSEQQKRHLNAYKHRIDALEDIIKEINH